MGQLELLPFQLLVLALWFGLAVMGVNRLGRKGYNTRFMQIAVFWVLPVVTLLYLVMEFVQPVSATWPVNLLGIIPNLLLLGLLCYLSPALLVASFIYPGKKGIDAPALALRQARFERYQGWFFFGLLVFMAAVIPLLALLLYPSNVAPTYDRVLGTFINGMLTGALISLVALGYTLVYGIVELINFAHGDVFMIGSLTGYGIMTVLLDAKSSTAVKGMPIPLVLAVIGVAIVAAMIVCATLNYLIDRIAYRRLRNAPRLAPLITAIGISFILQNIGFYIIGASPRGYPVLFPNQFGTNIDLVGDVFNNDKLLFQIPLTAFLVIIGVGVLLLAMRYLINSTKIGKAMRAVAQNREAAALMGVNINQTIGAAFLIGGALAGAAGVIYGIYNVNSTVRYDLGFQNGLFAFTAAVLGGIGNTNGAVLGGIFIGMIYSISQSDVFGLTSNYLSLSIWAPVAVFGVLVLVMIFRPTGILGENVPEKV
jgi:branched-chain amino acid transport system permease protein